MLRHLLRPLVSRATAPTFAAGVSARSFHGAVVRRAAPAFTADAVMPDGSFKKLSLSDYAGKYLVLVFYPLDFTFVCPTELCDFSDRAADFEKINAAVVGVSCDSVFSHLAFTKLARNKGGVGPLAIPLVGDISKAMSHSYGMLVEDADDDMDGLSLRGTVVISPLGKVVAKYNHDAPVGRSVDETLRIVQAFQHFDAHGEVCPSGWTPGKKTMQADPLGSQAYFNALK
jgi:alkyl hydroperoxide reductase subunit AhpC